MGRPSPPRHRLPTATVHRRHDARTVPRSTLEPPQYVGCPSAVGQAVADDDAPTDVRRRDPVHAVRKHRDALRSVVVPAAARYAKQSGYAGCTCRRHRNTRNRCQIPRARHRQEDVLVTYTIAQPCVDLKDLACVEECPVDCIYEGERMLYIHPDECVDCGACEPGVPRRSDLLRGRRPGPVEGIHPGQR